MRSWVLIAVCVGWFAAGWIAAGPRRIAPVSASPAPGASTYTVQREPDGAIYRKLAAEVHGDIPDVQTPSQTAPEASGLVIASRGDSLAP